MGGRNTRNLATDSRLLGRLRNWDDHESWGDFYRTYRKLIYGFARQQGLGAQEAEDVVQETLLSVAKALHTFRYDANRSSFRHWLWRLTRNRAIDHVRKRPRELPLSHRADPGTKRTGTAERIEDPHSLPPNEHCQALWEARVLQAALERLKRQVRPRHYQVFDLLVLQQQSPSRVAEALGIPVAQVYLARHRVKRKFNQMIEGVRGAVK